MIKEKARHLSFPDILWTVFHILPQNVCSVAVECGWGIGLFTSKGFGIYDISVALIKF